MPLAPEYQAMLAELAETPAPPFTELTPAEGREMYRLMRPVNPELKVADVVDRSIESPAGPVPVRI